MRTCGKFQLGREIAYSDDTALYAATGPSAKAGAVVKIWRVFDDESAQAVLTALDGQLAVVRAGCGGVLPIFERGLDDTGSPWCATPTCALSARKVIEAQNRMSSDHLERVIKGTLDALAELSLKCERPHGHLSAGNLLFSHADPSAKGFRIYLGDLADPKLAGTHRDDVYTLGRIIYQMVRGTERVAEHLNPPLELTAEWKYLGKDAGGWLQVCNRLLGASSTTGSGVLADALMALRDLDEHVATSGPKPSALKGTLVKAGAALLVLGAGAAGWQHWAHRPLEKPRIKIAKAGVDDFVRREAKDPLLAKYLSGLAPEVDGTLSTAAVNTAMTAWVGEQLRPLDSVIETGALEQMRADLAENVSVDESPARDLKSLESRVESLRKVFAQQQELLVKRQKISEAEEPILNRFDNGSHSFIHDWVTQQTHPGYTVEEMNRRLDRTLAELRLMGEFLRSQWPDLNQQDFLAELKRNTVDYTGENGVRDWLQLAEKFRPAVAVVEPPKAETPKVSPAVVTPAPPVEVAMAGPPSARLVPPPQPPVMPEPPPPDPKREARAKFDEFIQSLSQQMDSPTFTLAAAKDARLRFAKLRQAQLGDLQDDPAVGTLQTAFSKLPEAAPTAGFTLPTLEAKGWKAEKSGPEYAVYYRPDFQPVVRIPFHRVPADDGTAFAISAVEIPLVYAANSGGWTPGNPPPGPQVWYPAAGKVNLSPVWEWSNIKAAQNFLAQRPEMAGSQMYAAGSPRQPAWSTPMTGITGQMASGIAQALGGALPNYTQVARTAQLVQRSGWAAGAHVAGPALASQSQALVALETKLKGSSWKKGFFDVTGVGNAIWPDTGSYAPSKTHPAPAGQGGGSDLWFLPVDRQSAAAPEKIYDFFGNVAEFCEDPRLGLVITGGSAISSGGTDGVRAVPSQAYSDVGFRIVVPLNSAGGDPLTAFKESVRQVTSL